MEKRIFGLTGLMACGKGTVAKYLVEKYGAESFRFSTIVRDVLDRLYLEKSRANFQKMVPILLEGFGTDLLSKIMAQDVLKSDKNIIVVDGIRRFPDIEHLKKIPGFKLVAIEVEAKTRYQRLVARNENPGDAEKTWEQFLEEHKAATEIEIPDLMAQADIKIDNNASVEDLYKQLDELLK
jgi:dephospho-CoA kinase